jgi:CPA1 family monovalent cation:H+ antiporter
MNTLDVISVLAATAALFGWISARFLKLPITVGTMLLTVLASMAMEGAGTLAPGIHQWAVRLSDQIDFHSLILHGMLPLLLFAGTFMLDLRELAKQKLAISLFALVGTVLSVFLVAGLMELLFAGKTPWIECLLFGALIAPTDPIAVLEMLRRTGVPNTIQTQLAGESLFNDGIGAVLFITLLDAARGQQPTFWNVSGMLLLKAGGGILLGTGAAWIASHLMRRLNAYQVDILITLALALGGYAIAEASHLSGPLEAVAAGIALRCFNRNQPSERVAHDSVNGFWSVVDEVQNSLLFVLLGLEIMAVTLNGHTLRVGAAAILAVDLVRLAAVALLLGLLRWLRPRQPSSMFVLTWGGLRGGLSIALALSVPASLGRSWILGATYLVVVFSIVIQGGSMDWILRRTRRKHVTA